MSHTLSRRTRVALLTSCLAVSLAATASAGEPSSGANVVHWADPAIASGAQLIEHLQSEGYTDVRLSSQQPTPSTPHPEISAGLTREAAAWTPVHQGWTGTAVKDGRTVNIYVDEPTLPALAKGK